MKQKTQLEERKLVNNQNFTQDKIPKKVLFSFSSQESVKFPDFSLTCHEN